MMRTRTTKTVLAGALLPLLLAPPSGAQETRLSFERITSFPRMAGTAPSAPAWSPDGERLVFLWNDEGGAFRDVWIVSADGTGLRRLTRLRSEPEPAPSGVPRAASFEELRRDAEDRMAPGVTEAIFAPGGASVLFVHGGQIHRVALDTGESAALTRGGGAKSRLSVSPGGEYLSFLEGGDLHLWNQKTNELSRVTRLGVPPIGVIPGASFSGLDAGIVSYRWSPDGRFIAFELEDRRAVRTMLFPDYLEEETRAVPLRRDLPGENEHLRSLGIYSVESGRMRELDLPGKTERRLGSYEWSPDGSQVLVDQNSETAEDRFVYVVDPEDGAARVLWHSHQEKAGSTTSASSLWTSVWRSDGKGVLLVTDIGGRHHVYALPLEGGEPRPLTSGEWSVVGSAFEGSGFTASAPRKEVFFVSTKKNPYERQVYRMSENGGPVEEVTTLAGTHQFWLSPDGRRLASLHSSDVAPPELYLVDVEGGAGEKRVTRSPAEEYEGHSWIEPKYVTFPSRVDDAVLHGRLFEPPERDPSKKYPAIIGPVYANTVRNRWDERFSLLQQFLALEGGYVVLQVDVRGSVGYGRAFREKFIYNVGEIDIEDLHSGVDYLETLPYVDPDRIGVWGWSYGGLLAAMSLFKKPGVYQAGVAGAPATNVWHATTGEVDLFGRPQARPEVYRKGSAVEFADGLADPLMIIHGMQDSIVLFQDTVNLAEKLMMLGKDFDLVVLPSSVHDGTRKDFTALHLMRKLVEHFDRHLGRGPR